MAAYNTFRILTGVGRGHLKGDGVGGGLGFDEGLVVTLGGVTSVLDGLVVGERLGLNVGIEVGSRLLGTPEGDNEGRSVLATLQRKRMVLDGQKSQCAFKVKGERKYLRRSCRAERRRERGTSRRRESWVERWTWRTLRVRWQKKELR